AVFARPPCGRFEIPQICDRFCFIGSGGPLNLRAARVCDRIPPIDGIGQRFGDPFPHLTSAFHRPTEASGGETALRLMRLRFARP
ncbi:MAG: hypothetical protein ACI8Y6_001671, partial [Brevundimonas sp.]